MSRLELVKRGKLKTPKKIFIYGGAGLGKTTLASFAPKPIFVDIDDGSKELDVARYPFSDDPIVGHIPDSYPSVVVAVEDLTNTQHEYLTAVFDTGDKLENLIHKYICGRDSKKKQSGRNQDAEALSTIVDYGYGKGYDLAVDELRLFLFKLDCLRAKGVSIVILAHAQIKSFKNPLGGDYDRYIPKVNEKFFGVIKEWADLTGFLSLDGGASKEVAGDKRYRGFSTGARILHTAPNAAYEAKTRLMLPESIEIPQVNPWGPIAAAIKDSDEISIEELCAKIVTQFERFAVDSPFRVKGLATTVKATNEGNRDQLIKILNYVESTPNKETKEVSDGK
jgi:hypothetical protein